METSTIDPKVKDEIIDYVVTPNYNYSPLRDIWKHKRLYKDLIPQEFTTVELNSVWFTPDDKGFIWDKDFIYRPLKYDDGKDFIRFEGDFSVNGYLSFQESTTYDKREVPVTYNLTFKVDYFKRIRLETVEYWTKEQKIMNSYNYLMLDQYKKLGFHSQMNNPQTDFVKFTGIWGGVSRSNKKQVHTSSFYYHYEIVTSYELLMFLVSNVNLYRQYTSNYLEQERHDYSNGSIFDLNLSIYDRYYLIFCSLSLENLYSYWERIGFLLFQFIKPTKVSDRNLSFQKLISSLNEEDNNGEYSFLLSSKNFKWLSDFNISTHNKLQKYRHPLIHYNIKNPLFKGGLFSGTVSYWIQNNMKKEKIEKLQKENDKLVDIINHQFSLCNDGLVKTLDLIKEIEVIQ
jgi:hypothetical protein